MVKPESRETKTWLNGINATEGTRRNYNHVINDYCEYLNTTTEDLIKGYLQDIKEGKLMPERQVFHDLPGYMAELKGRGLAPKTINVYRAALKSMFRFYYIETPYIKTGRIKTLPDNSNKFLKREQVRDMLNHAIHLRNRALIMVMATSGMASNEVRKLKIGQISFDDNDVGTVKLRREKVMHDYYTFISPEATAVLRDYWREREQVIKQCKEQRENGTNKCFIKTFPKKGQSVNGNWDYFEDCEGCFKVRTKDNGRLSDNDYVFTGMFKDKIVQNIPMSERVFLRMFNQIGVRAGYEAGTKTKMSETRSHALRKFFSSSLQRAGMPKNDIDWLLGHAPDDTDLAYFDNSEIERIKNEYIRNLAALAITKDIIIETADKKIMEQQAAEIAKLQDRITMIEQAGADMAEARVFLQSNPEDSAALARRVAEILKDQS